MCLTQAVRVKEGERHVEKIPLSIYSDIAAPSVCNETRMRWFTAAGAHSIAQKLSKRLHINPLNLGTHAMDREEVER